jgi:LEA14-like dessication related protein
LNPRIIVGGVAAAFAIAVGIIAFSGQSFINDVSDKGIFSGSSDSQSSIIPITVELEDLSIVEVTEKHAILKIKFLVSNPNYKSVILPYLKYQLYEDDQKVHVGEIGQRGEGFVVGSNYFTVLSQSSTTISDEIIIKNSGNTPELWSDLTENTANWKITGEAFFNLSSMTTGGENEITFEFTR